MIKKERKHKADNSKRNVILMFVLIAVICVSVTKFLYDSYAIVEVRKIPMEVVVRDTLGMGFKDDVMMFGGIPPGASSEREMVIVNYKEIPMKVHIKFKGDMGQWVQEEENDFILKGNEEKRINFIVSIPDGTKNGEYKGETIIFFKR